MKDSASDDDEMLNTNMRLQCWKECVSCRLSVSFGAAGSWVSNVCFEG